VRGAKRVKKKGKKCPKDRAEYKKKFGALFDTNAGLNLNFNLKSQKLKYS